MPRDEFKHIILLRSFVNRWRRGRRDRFKVRAASRKGGNKASKHRELP